MVSIYLNGDTSRSVMNARIIVKHLNGYAHGLEQGKDKCCEEVAAFKTESEAKILILEKELENRPALDNLSVTVNGERYKII